MKTNRPTYFVLGTRAQFIKVAPLMREMKAQGMEYVLIYTAQHRENVSDILDIYGLPEPDRVMFQGGEANTKMFFLRWFFAIFFQVLFRSRVYLPRPGIVLTHGDTFTAWIAALMGKLAGCKVGHIESGCRSFNLLSPFPEEISRLITFQLTDIFFCSDAWAVNNLKRYRGTKVNLGANTILDGVRFALSSPYQPAEDFESGSYAVVSIHRFENIFTPRFTEVILPTLKNIAAHHRLVFTLHPTTRERLRKLGLYAELQNHPNIILHPRFGFVPWLHVCNRAEFVITDGGSNQEELSYLGVPTLLFRKETERQEGLGANIVLSNFDPGLIERFLTDPQRYRTPALALAAQPSRMIIKTLLEEDRTVKPGEKNDEQVDK